MKKLLIALVAMISLAASIPIVMPTSSPVTASVIVGTFCDMTLSKPSVNFGSPIPGQQGSQDSVTISMPNGNTQLTPTISGSGWAGSGSNSMLVGQTVWGTVSPTTQLTGYEVATALISYGNPVTIYLNVNIPSGQAADTYSQTITITGCGG